MYFVSIVCSWCRGGVWQWAVYQSYRCRKYMVKFSASDVFSRLEHCPLRRSSQKSSKRLEGLFLLMKIHGNASIDGGCCTRCCIYSFLRAHFAPRCLLYLIATLLGIVFRNLFSLRGNVRSLDGKNFDLEFPTGGLGSFRACERSVNEIFHFFSTRTYDVNFRFEVVFRLYSSIVLLRYPAGVMNTRKLCTMNCILRWTKRSPFFYPSLLFFVPSHQLYRIIYRSNNFLDEVVLLLLCVVVVYTLLCCIVCCAVLWRWHRRCVGKVICWINFTCDMAYTIRKSGVWCDVSGTQRKCIFSSSSRYIWFCCFFPFYSNVLKN